MFVMYEKENMKVPVRVWLKERKDLEGSCLEQAYHLSQLPFLHKWVSLMPDTHAGKGMPIGGVIAADGVDIPLIIRNDDLLTHAVLSVRIYHALYIHYHFVEICI